MNKFSKFLCDPAKVVKTVVAFGVCVGVVIYVYLQVMGGFGGGLVTETAMHVSLNETIATQAVVFRDETIMEKSGDGTIVTVVSEGERVSKGQLVANVYSDGDDAVLQDEINRINRSLEILENSSVDKQFVISDLRQLDDDIESVFSDIYKSSSKGNLSSAIGYSSDLLVKLNKRDLIVESDFDISSEVDKLRNERADLESRIQTAAEPIFATGSGYFFADVDGYENIFSISSVEKITLSDFEKMTASSPDEELLDSGSVKLINDFVWYLVCSLDADKARTLTEGWNYKVLFPENADYEMTMMLDRIVSETNSTEALAVFRVNVLPNDFNYKRFQNAEIVIKGVEGISVPKKAFRVVNNIEGVYILVGDVVRFRTIERIAEKDEYYIVKIKSNDAVFVEEDGSETEIKHLSLYDSIIVSGKNLFDGKIIG